MPQSDIKEFSSQELGFRFQEQMVNRYRTSNISNPLIFQFFNSLFCIPHSQTGNPPAGWESEGQIHNRKRLHSLPLVVIFPDAFAYSSAADSH